MNYIARLLLVTITVLIPLGSIAEVKSTKKQHQKVPVKKKTEDPEKYISFDTNLMKLPPNFRGHRGYIVYDELQDRLISAKKGQFEKSEEYKRRMEELELTAVVGNLFLDSFYAFKDDGFERTGHENKFQYVPDKEELTINSWLYNRGKPGCFEDNTIARDVDSFSQDTTYLGTNAFGATTKVYSTRKESYDIVTDNCDRLNGISTTIKATPQKAKRLAENRVSILYICTLRDPYVLDTRSYGYGATFSSPSSFHNESHQIAVTIREIWWYDFERGEILAKHKIQDNGTSEGAAPTRK